MTERPTTDEPLVFHRIEMEEFSTPSRLPLVPQEIRIHAFWLHAHPEIRIRCAEWLSKAEQDRAERFRFNQDRDEYVVAHGYVRTLLGRYLGVRPGALELVTQDGGKPTVVDGGGRPSYLRFSLSHSHGCGLLAVSEGFEVGVDLEMVRADVDHLKLAERFFSMRESLAIRRQTTNEAQRESFFRHWVGKEAVLKSLGTGLRFPLDACELQFEPDGNRASVRWGQCQAEGHPWDVRLLSLDQEWVGAVAGKNTGWTVTYCR